MLRVYLAGEICVENGSHLLREAELPGRQGRVAFGLLVLERRRPVARDQVAEVLWPGDLPRAWPAAVSALVSKLRSLLARTDAGTGIATVSGSYQLQLPTGAWVDLEAAQESLHQAEGALRAGAPELAYPPAVVAGSILRRPFLPGADNPWIDARREQLRGYLLRALDCLVELHLWNHEAVLARQLAEESVRLEPIREAGHRALMRAHLAAGNRAEAIQAYERCRRLLADELGAGPGVEIQALYAEIVGEGVRA